MASLAVETATTLILERELFCEVVVVSQLQPLDLEPVVDSVGRTGALVTLEEGTVTGGVGAELAAAVQARAWEELRRPVQRVGAADGIIPAAPGLEAEMLPSAADLCEAVLAVAGARV